MKGISFQKQEIFEKLKISIYENSLFTFHPIDSRSKNLFSLSLLSYSYFDNPWKEGTRYVSPSGQVLEYSPPARFGKVSCY